MPMPTEERVSRLVAGPVAAAGFDLEGVEIAQTAGQARVRVIVDSDAAADLDTISRLSGELSEHLDRADDFGATRYLLEVTTPGVDRPLTAPRHWRRARGRKARITLAPGAPAPEPDLPGRFAARIGPVGDAEVTVVLAGKRGPRAVTVPLGNIDHAVVEVEFAAPDARELELTGGVAPGRPVAGADAVDPAETPVAESDSIEGIME